jgi:hypothetical protein
MNYFYDEIVRNNALKAKGIGSFKYCPEFYKNIGNIQKKRIYLYGASSKVGKTTVCDYLHILVPFIEGYTNIKYYYYGWEINISDKMAGFCAFFLSHKYQLDLDANTVTGLIRDLTEYELACIKDIYDNELRVLFGEYDEEGNCIKAGIIEYIEDRFTPSQFKEEMNRVALLHGIFSKKGKYIWLDVTQHVHIIIDHIGKVDKGNYETKKAIDKLSDYCVIYRNLCHFTFIIISQFNRSLTAIERRGQMSYMIRPEKTDFKDTSNLSEDCNFLFAFFNPLIIGELDDIRIGSKRYMLRKGDKLLVEEGFRGLYLLEARNVRGTFELAFNLKNNYIEII